MEVVTLSKKCKYWTARNIALAVSQKAFEHLEAPFRESYREVHQACIRKVEDDLGTTIEKLSTHKLALLVRQTSLKITTADGANELHLHIDDGEDVWHFNAPYTSTIIKDNALHAKLEAIQQAHAPILRKKEALADEIQLQLTNKTFKTILKEWPELTDIINSVVEIRDRDATSMTVPFERLLSRFLPALPAPEGGLQ